MVWLLGRLPKISLAQGIYSGQFNNLSDSDGTVQDSGLYLISNK